MVTKESAMKRLVVIVLLVLIFLTQASFAQANFDIPNIQVQIGSEDGNLTSTVQVLILLTVLSIAPSIIIMTTCFTRIIIILSFLRKALALQSTPPNQVLVGLALFLTLFIMTPVFTDIYNDAYLPMSEGAINQQEAFDRAIEPLRGFMFKQVRSEDLALFLKLSESEAVTSLDDVSTTALIPAFMISELKTGFIVGFLLFIPFIVIDMVVASTLMSLGMMMLPPVMISLPFKVLLFILIDGWNLLIKAIVAGIAI
jgi:flagellar biosynthetic protein FliP